MKKENVKNIIILILIITTIILVITYLLKFSDNSNITKLIKDSLVVQLNVSEYIGKIKSDTFDIYTTEQLMIGSTDIQNIDTTRIKDNDDNDLLQIVSIEDKISYNDTMFYKINMDNLKKIFDINLYQESGITWYIGSTGDIKVNYITKPTWWSQELDIIYVGN
ncbi:MAG: hypothetical protein PHD15_00740 [Clostridia bacterium]|nr:hypothetical protein [Clostridia bacterium]MDD4386277.1 hypothetical protein [Clostridia bacterium]